MTDWSAALPWSVVVRTGPTWTRYPAPDIGAAVRVAAEYRAAGYTAVAASCKCGTVCRCTRDENYLPNH